MMLPRDMCLGITCVCGAGTDMCSWFWKPHAPLVLAHYYRGAHGAEHGYLCVLIGEHAFSVLEPTPAAHVMRPYA
jgi:hypothetical protein